MLGLKFNHISKRCYWPLVFFNYPDQRWTINMCGSRLCSAMNRNFIISVIMWLIGLSPHMTVSKLYAVTRYLITIDRECFRLCLKNNTNQSGKFVNIRRSQNVGNERGPILHYPIRLRRKWYITVVLYFRTEVRCIGSRNSLPWLSGWPAILDTSLWPRTLV